MPRRQTAQDLFSAHDDDGRPLLTPQAVRRRRIVGAVCLLLAVVLLFALMTYDWHDVAWLCNPPSDPPANAMGKVGAWLTFFGYSVAGLAYRYFAVPFLVAFAALLLHGRVPRFRLRAACLLSLYAVAACIFQNCGGEGGLSIPLLAELNLCPNAGGAVGQWLVTGLLRPLLGPVGVPLLLFPLAGLLTVFFVGFRNCVLLLVKIATPRHPASTEEPWPEGDVRGDLLRAAEHEASRQLPAASGRKGFFLRLFRRRAEEEAPQEPEDIRALLRDRAKVPPPEDAWSPPPPAAEPLFDAPQTVEPPPAPAPARPQPELLKLSAEDQPILKPVSPLIAETAPSVAGHDNAQPEEPSFQDYRLPPVKLLDPVPPLKQGGDDVSVATRAIESVFEQFNVDAKVVDYVRGPVVTQFEIRPARGVRVNSFNSYEKDLLLALRAESLRIQTPIPGRDVVGIEVPNSVRQSVTLREVLEGKVWKEAERRMALPLALGKLATGGDLVVDLAEMPHLLVAGGTGSGKSVSVNGMLMGLLMSRTPEQLRLLMVDPKRVEFTAYEDLPHLLNPVIVEPKKVLFSLKWATKEMERRYNLLQRYGVRNIGDFNKRVEKPLPHRENPVRKLPYIVLIIDELADLMLSVKAEIEEPITSLTQKARAAGIHLIIATQRPTTDIITGTIKANIPGRLALRVAQSNDSRTILGFNGAENLIGKGDMLLSRGGGAAQRSQAAWVSDDEIARVCSYIREQAGPAFDNYLADSMERIREEQAGDELNAYLRQLNGETAADVSASSSGDLAVDDGDKALTDEDLYERALTLIRQTGRYSTSVLQRRLKIGYSRAARITDLLEERGIIGAGGKAGGSREILVDLNAEDRAKMAGTDGESAAFDTRDPAFAPAAFQDEALPDDLSPDALDLPDAERPS